MRGALLLALLAGCTAANPTYDRHLAELCERTGNCRPDLLGYTNDAGTLDLTPGDALPPPPGDLADVDASGCSGRGVTPWEGHPCCPWAYERPVSPRDDRPICCETRIDEQGRPVAVCQMGYAPGDICDLAGGFRECASGICEYDASVGRNACR